MGAPGAGSLAIQRRMSGFLRTRLAEEDATRPVLLWR